MKMHLCERFKIDVLGTSQGRYAMDVFSGRFEEVYRTVLQDCKNKQQLTLYEKPYFPSPEISFIGSKTS